MPFTIRSRRRSSMQCALTNNAGPFLKFFGAQLWGGAVIPLFRRIAVPWAMLVS
jgi:hypothetical protein